MLRALLLVFGLVHASPFVHVRDPFGVRHRIKRAAVDLILREARWALIRNKNILIIKLLLINLGKDGKLIFDVEKCS